MKAILGGLAGAVLFAASAHAAIVQNGSFESGSLSPGWQLNNLSGVTPGRGVTVVDIGGGTDSTGYGDVIPSYNGATHAAFFVDDLADQTIFQTVSLSANTTYKLNFGLFQTLSGASNGGGFTLTDSLGGTAMTFTNSDVAAGSWTSESGSFKTVLGGDYTLSYKFTSGSTPSKDLLLTGVELSAVPLPASAPLFGAALLALAGFGYGMSRRAAPKSKAAA